MESQPTALVLADQVGEASERAETRLRLQKALNRVPAIYRQALVDYVVRISREKDCPPCQNPGRNRAQPNPHRETAASRGLGGLT
jgi:hypothetical protein